MTASTPPDTRPVLRVEGLTKTYASTAEKVTATLDVTFTVRRGELVLIMGPSGSGKTTLLLLCGGLLAPTAGRVWVDGVDLTRLTERRLPDLRLSKIGFVFQTANLLANLTAAENVRIVLEAAGRPRPEVQRRAYDLLTSLELEHRLDHLPAELSGGQRQRVAIARALANNPPLVLADEPTGALDSRTGGAVMEILRRRVDADGTSVVCVTHDPRIVTLADRVLWLEDGRLVAAEQTPTPEALHGDAMGGLTRRGTRPSLAKQPIGNGEDAVEERSDEEEKVVMELGVHSAEVAQQRPDQYHAVGEQAPELGDVVAPVRGNDGIEQVENVIEEDPPDVPTEDGAKDR